MEPPRQHLPQAPNAGKPGYRRIPRNSLIAELHSVAGRIISPQRYGTVPRMDQLPVEILHEIFGYACTDGSRTACSLSLVSRRIHAASRATLFPSVLLIDGSLETLTKFLNRFQGDGASARMSLTKGPAPLHPCGSSDLLSVTLGTVWVARTNALDQPLAATDVEGTRQ